MAPLYEGGALYGEALMPGLGVCDVIADEKAGLKPDTFEGGGRGGSELGFAPGGGGYDMMNLLRVAGDLASSFYTYLVSLSRNIGGQVCVCHRLGVPRPEEQFARQWLVREGTRCKAWIVYDGRRQIVISVVVHWSRDGLVDIWKWLPPPKGLSYRAVQVSALLVIGSTSLPEVVHDASRIAHT